MSNHQRIARQIEVEGYTVDHPQYHRGASAEDYDDVALGVGNTPAEALENALEILAQGDWNLDTVVPDTAALALEHFGTDADTDVVTKAALQHFDAPNDVVTYTVRFVAHNGMSQPSDEYSIEANARIKVAKRIREARAKGYTVSTLSLRRRWEIADPESGVRDDEGILSLSDNAEDIDEQREKYLEENELQCYVIVRVSEHDPEDVDDDTLEDRDAPTLADAMRDGLHVDGTVYATDDPCEPGGTGTESLEPLSQYDVDTVPADKPAPTFDRRGRELVITIDVASGCDYGGSGILGRANLQSLKELADQYGLRYQEQSGAYDGFGIVFPLHVRSRALLEALKALSDYPILDESLMGQLEMDAEGEAWDNGGIGHDFKNALAEAFPTRDFDNVDDGALYDLFRKGMEVANVYWEHETSGLWIDVEPIVESLELADIDAAEGIREADELISSRAVLVGIVGMAHAIATAENAEDVLEGIQDALRPRMLADDPLFHRLRCFAGQFRTWDGTVTPAVVSALNASAVELSDDTDRAIGRIV